MRNRIEGLVAENDEMLQAISKKLFLINQTIAKTNIALYKDFLTYCSDDALAFDFSERIGNETGEFEWYMYHFGREKVEELLFNKYEYEKQSELEGLS